ncbi:MAG: 16S rRNA (cytosine(1402)-N(4))-methyltransferase RsmH [Parcubacteria group bacterium]|nr:16S rRNA (cytosine(1402)-N(4))-methyltransferase RsmH [Parcubacteria group bacterium]
MTKHTPVLLKETIAGLLPKEGDIVVDGTLGGGGHAEALGEKIGESGILIGIDEDEHALRTAEKKIKKLPCRLCLQRLNFRNIDTALQVCKVEKTDIVLLDLGLSSMQLTESGRGFSFHTKDPLLMTFAAHPKEGALTAYEIVNYWDEKKIAKIIQEYGEERRARDIAHAIVKRREIKRIGYAHELAEVIEKAIGGRREKTHPATKTFQAIRIVVNDELSALKEGLEKGLQVLNSGGKIGVISFHSLEDRIAKQFFKKQEREGNILILTKKPITPSREEVSQNSRARSAKLRIAQKL